MKRAFVDGCFDVASSGSHVKTDIGIFNARPIFGFGAAFSCFKKEIVEAAIGRVHLECFFGTDHFLGPLKVQCVDQAANFVGLKRLPSRWGQRQLKGNVSKCEQIQSVALKTALRTVALICF